MRKDEHVIHILYRADLRKSVSELATREPESVLLPRNQFFAHENQSKSNLSVPPNANSLL